MSRAARRTGRGSNLGRTRPGAYHRGRAPTLNGETTLWSPPRSAPRASKFRDDASDLTNSLDWGPSDSRSLDNGSTRAYHQGRAPTRGWETTLWSSPRSASRASRFRDDASDSTNGPALDWGPSDSHSLDDHRTPLSSEDYSASLDSFMSDDDEVQEGCAALTPFYLRDFGCKMSYDDELVEEWEGRDDEVPSVDTRIIGNTCTLLTPSSTAPSLPNEAASAPNLRIKPSNQGSALATYVDEDSNKGLTSPRPNKVRRDIPLPQVTKSSTADSLLGSQAGEEVGIDDCKSINDMNQAEAPPSLPNADDPPQAMPQITMSLKKDSLLGSSCGEEIDIDEYESDKRVNMGRSGVPPTPPNAANSNKEASFSAVSSAMPSSKHIMKSSAKDSVLGSEVGEEMGISDCESLDTASSSTVVSGMCGKEVQLANYLALSQHSTGSKTNSNLSPRSPRLRRERGRSMVKMVRPAATPRKKATAPLATDEKNQGKRAIPAAGSLVAEGSKSGAVVTKVIKTVRSANHPEVTPPGILKSSTKDSLICSQVGEEVGMGDSTSVEICSDDNGMSKGAFCSDTKSVRPGVPLPQILKSSTKDSVLGSQMGEEVDIHDCESATIGSSSAEMRGMRGEKVNLKSKKLTGLPAAKDDKNQASNAKPETGPVFPASKPKASTVGNEHVDKRVSAPKANLVSPALPFPQIQQTPTKDSLLGSQAGEEVDIEEYGRVDTSSRSDDMSGICCVKVKGDERFGAGQYSPEKKPTASSNSAKFPRLPPESSPKRGGSVLKTVQAAAVSPAANTRKQVTGAMQAVESVVAAEPSDASVVGNAVRMNGESSPKPLVSRALPSSQIMKESSAKESLCGSQVGEEVGVEDGSLEIPLSFTDMRKEASVSAVSSAMPSSKHIMKSSAKDSVLGSEVGEEMGISDCESMNTASSSTVMSGPCGEEVQLANYLALSQHSTGSKTSANLSQRSFPRLRRERGRSVVKMVRSAATSLSQRKKATAPLATDKRNQGKRAIPAAGSLVAAEGSESGAVVNNVMKNVRSANRPEVTPLGILKSSTKDSLICSQVGEEDSTSVEICPDFVSMSNGVSCSDAKAIGPGVPSPQILKSSTKDSVLGSQMGEEVDIHDCESATIGSSSDDISSMCGEEVTLDEHFLALSGYPTERSQTSPFTNAGSPPRLPPQSSPQRGRSLASAGGKSFAPSKKSTGLPTKDGKKLVSNAKPGPRPVFPAGKPKASTVGNERHEKSVSAPDANIVNTALLDPQKLQSSTKDSLLGSQAGEEVDIEEYGSVKTSSSSDPVDAELTTHLTDAIIPKRLPPQSPKKQKQGCAMAKMARATENEVAPTGISISTYIPTVSELSSAQSAVESAQEARDDVSTFRSPCKKSIHDALIEDNSTRSDSTSKTGNKAGSKRESQSDRVAKSGSASADVSVTAKLVKQHIDRHAFLESINPTEHNTENQKKFDTLFNAMPRQMKRGQQNHQVSEGKKETAAASSVPVSSALSKAMSSIADSSIGSYSSIDSSILDRSSYAEWSSLSKLSSVLSTMSIGSSILEDSSYAE